MRSIVFFRNDDVRDVLDSSLITINNLFVEFQIPIAHAVEPANVTPEVVKYLLELKRLHPDLIEIIQHGFKHQLNYRMNISGKIKKGEFGGNRNYIEQFEEINEGKRLMNYFFSENWFHAFTFPYGARNEAAIKAVSDCGFKIVNGSMGASFKYDLLYFIGQLLKREMLFNRKISWNLKHKPGTNLFQIDTSISLIKKFNDEYEDAEFFTLDELKYRTIDYINKKQNVGFVLHHRYHNSTAKIKLVRDFLCWLKTIPGLEFSTMENIYNKYV